LGKVSKNVFWPRKNLNKNRIIISVRLKVVLGCRAETSLPLNVFLPPSIGNIQGNRKG
jgi:hypothetical protein